MLACWPGMIGFSVCLMIHGVKSPGPAGAEETANRGRAKRIVVRNEDAGLRHQPSDQHAFMLLFPGGSE